MGLVVGSGQESLHVDALSKDFRLMFESMSLKLTAAPRNMAAIFPRFKNGSDFGTPHSFPAAERRIGT